jgi:dimethylhistidine N-methyltransferase
MCRHVAFLTRTPIALEQVLKPFVEQAQQPRHQTSGNENPDGWGVGWFDDDGRVQRARSAQPIWEDPERERLGATIRTTAGLGAARLASPGSPVEETGSAPFTDGHWLFSLNGIVDGYHDGVGDELRSLVSPGRLAGITGAADSEVLFALTLDHLDRGDAPIDALAAVVDTVFARTTGRLNLLLTDGVQIAATANGNSLFVCVDSDRTVVASEPLDADPGWERVPDGTHGTWTLDVRVDVCLTPDDLATALADDVRRGLTATPKELPPKWFYDDRGSELFDEITRLPEYYPTRAERSILDARAGEIAAVTRADTLVELGSGTSEKTRLLLDALAGAGTLARFVPFDVSEQTLRDAAAAIARDYGVGVHAVVGDFEHHLGRIPTGGTRLVAFLGGTIGNLAPAARARFLADVAAGLAPGDTFLLGTDLVKDVGRLEAAYDDAAGVTAAFNRNVLHVVNRALDADFDPDAFDHVARWNPVDEWIEMLLRARRDQHVVVGALDLEVGFAAGEEMRTEISAKFRRERVASELAAAGLELAAWWTDEPGDFALSLAHLAGDGTG